MTAPDNTDASGEFSLDPSGNLEVAGNFIAQGGTQLNVPDYVFEPDYPLMSLDELADFIDENHHLPDVPSASEIDEAGALNMTQMQLLLLRKVEELTLYTLQQEETIDRLQKQADARGY